MTRCRIYYYLLFLVALLCSVVGHTDCCLSKFAFKKQEDQIVDNTMKTKKLLKAKPTTMAAKERPTATQTTTTTKTTTTEVHWKNSRPIHNRCSQIYDLNYCLNGGTCYNYTIAQFTIPYCECADGFLGERCERKYFSQSYETVLRSNHRIRIHRASMYYGALVALFLTLCFCFICYNYRLLMPYACWFN